jgi:hypothetical protein
MADTVQNLQQPRLCPKDCKKCALAQQVYCSAQLSFTSFELMNKILVAIGELKSSIDALAGAATALASPIADDAKPQGKQTREK